MYVVFSFNRKHILMNFNLECLYNHNKQNLIEINEKKVE